MGKNCLRNIREKKFLHGKFLKEFAARCDYSAKSGRSVFLIILSREYFSTVIHYHNLAVQMNPHKITVNKYMDQQKAGKTN